MKQSAQYSLLVLVIYALLTVFMTWPVILHLTDGIPGDGFDGWQNLWNLWWVKQALLVEGSNPYFTPYIYPPYGASLLFHTLNIFNSFWTLPLQLNFGLAIAYNSVVIASFVLAGFGAYLLSLHTLTHLFPRGRGLRMAAFAGGLVFTMSPFHLAHLLGHMQVFSMIWPPFYVLWLLKTLAPWSTSAQPPPHQGRNTAISTLFLVLATLVDWYHTLYLLMFTGLVLLWTIWQRWRAARNTQYAIRSSFQPLLIVLAVGVSFAVIMSPLLIPMIRDAGSRPNLDTGLVQNITLSADLLAFVTPSEMHPLWGQWAKSIADNFSTTTSERLIFAGFVPLALAIFIIIWQWKSSIIKFWTVITTTFFALALGPFLHIGGKIVAIGNWQIPMPYLFLYYTVPFINLTRSLSRYDLMVMLGLGVLVSASLIQLQLLITHNQFQKPSSPRLRSGLAFISHQSSFIIPTLAAALILFEFLPIPYPVSEIDTPEFYYDISLDSDDYTIAELPMNWDRPTPLLHQTTHGKRVLTAYTSRDQAGDLTRRTPVFQQWRYLGPDIIDQPLDQIAPTIFYDFNLRYIVLDYWQMPPGPERDGTEQWLAAALPEVEPIYEDGRLKVYASPQKTDTLPYLSLGEGWSDRQQLVDGSVSRTFSNAELFLHHPQNRPFTLEITAATDQAAGQTLLISAGNEPIATIQLKPTFSKQTVLLPLQNDSLTKIILKADPPAGVIAVSRVGLVTGEQN